MSSVPSLGIQEKANTPHQAFVTTGAFDTAIFSYTTGTTLTNGQIVTTGVLTALNSSDMGSYNAAGTVLRVNGKKLIPDVHPITTGTKQYYVGVYHPVFGAGFIDPNNPLFVPMTSDKANSLNTTANGYYLDADRGPGVFTTGAILSSSSTAGVGYTTGAGSTSACGNFSGSPLAASVTVTGGRMCGTITGGGSGSSFALSSGTSATISVSNSSISANDVVIVSVKSISSGSIVANIGSINTGTFVIVLTAGANVSLSSTFSINYAIIKTASS